VRGRYLISLLIIIIINTNSISILSQDLETNTNSINKVSWSYVNNLLVNTPRTFTENRGQLENDDVRFYAQDGGIWFTDSGMWLEIREFVENRGQRSEAGNQGFEDRLNPMARFESIEPIKYRRIILKQEFVDANTVRPEGRHRLSWNRNFFYGNDSSKWKTEVPNYREIYYENLYDGIDLRYYQIEKGLKYDLIVHPEGNIKQIQIRYKGAENLKIDDYGNLIVETPIEEIIDGELFIYQEDEDIINPIKGKFVKSNDLEYGFEIIDDYDHQRALVIDPNIALEYSTYIGGSRDEEGFSVATDIPGNVYVTGWTTSTDFPNTTGACDTTHNGKLDVFVLQFNQIGSKLIYSTYVGGSEWDWYLDSPSIAIDLFGNTFVAGTTRSPDFPTTPDAYDIALNGSSFDIFVFKLNWNGSTLLYSTYIGGDAPEHGYDIAIDSIGNAYVTGMTMSSDFPTTHGAYDTTFNLFEDIFILKLNSMGSDLIYSTFIGGNGDDYAHGIAVDSTGYAYITGTTCSSGFPITEIAYNKVFSGGSDAFVLKLNLNGSAIIYSTYVGGESGDNGYDIAIDSGGNVYVTGTTQSMDFPTTDGAFNTSFNGNIDLFIFKLNQTGSDLIFSTFIGGSGANNAWSIKIDPIGNTLLTGCTSSSDFPTTRNAINKSYGGGEWDGFVLMLSSNGTELIYSTYIGGNMSDKCSDIELDLYGNAYVTGGTDSRNFPITQNVYNSIYNGMYEVFLLKFSLPRIVNITSSILIMDNNTIDTIYSQYSVYTFRVSIIDTAFIHELNVRLTLDPFGTNIQLLWGNGNQYSELFDPNNVITLKSSNWSYNYSNHEWVIDFNVIFNWTYPDEKFHDVQAFAFNESLPFSWFNTTNLYRVENDLMFNGTLSINDIDNKTVHEYDLIRGGEKLIWTGLTPIYEGTTNIFPPSDEVDVTIWDETGNSWLDSAVEGENFTIETITPSITDLDGDIHIINLTGIPPECDATNETFVIRIDADNVKFSNPMPDNSTWQTTSLVTTSVNITDIGGGVVNGSSVKRSFSTNNGVTWSDWSAFPGLKSAVNVVPQDLILLTEGRYNLVKWQAKDSVGNGPVESEKYIILVDTKNVTFSIPRPTSNYESPKEEVSVGITISDITSGVDTSTVEYAISNSFRSR
jgi:hypothetical protein